jgi:hypothetical protein
MPLGHYFDMTRVRGEIIVPSKELAIFTHDAIKVRILPEAEDTVDLRRPVPTGSACADTEHRELLAQMAQGRGQHRGKAIPLRF